MHRTIAASRRFWPTLTALTLFVTLSSTRARAEEPVMLVPLETKTPAEGAFFADDELDRAIGIATTKPTRPKLVPDASGAVRVGKERFTVLWSAPGKIAAKRAGEYDKTRDVRRPDRFVWLDIATGKILAEHEITDPAGLARIAQLHATHAGLGTFAHMPADGKWLRVVDGEEEWDVPVARPLGKYDPESLRFMRIDDARLLLSLSVDPVNREAVARKKADRDDIDFYLVTLSTKTATRVGTIEGKARPTAWRWGGDKLALLRKSKNFSTGGVALELYALPLATTR